MARQVTLAGAMLSFLSKAVCVVRLPLSTNTRYHLPVGGRGEGGGEGEERGGEEGKRKRVKGREERGEKGEGKGGERGREERGEKGEEGNERREEEGKYKQFNCHLIIFHSVVAWVHSINLTVWLRRK